MPTYPKRPRAYVTFQIRLPPDLKRQLEDYAFQTQQSQIAVVTAALEDYLRRVTELESKPDIADESSGPGPNA
ncbi:hypothetical protein Sulac_2243 [Sulfobacillus acidophilus DSM 10332]|uniref:Uncharacterized protein n=1 Tax=Sulfobacillus acidophilus (strain ATCC 700253 / DSM 10332 / NAL) TaxID=679936 RepID=G8TU44_SULAD|nr:hypothetical protein Sulac_2243 [Sulfobacillus acidophilus DSM 10332]